MKTVLSIMIALCAIPLAVQAQGSPIAGAWRVTSIAQPGGQPEPHDPPSLYLFMDGHYSAMRVTGPRPEQMGPDATVVEAFRTFDANAGTYEVSGDRVTIHPVVAKNPGLMNGQFSLTWQYQLEGNVLTFTQLTGRFQGTVTTLERLE